MLTPVIVWSTGSCGAAAVQPHKRGSRTNYLPRENIRIQNLKYGFHWMNTAFASRKVEKSSNQKKKKNRRTSVSQEVSALKTEISDYVFRDHFYSSWWKKFLWMWRASKTLASLVFPPECEASFWCWFYNCHLPLMIILLFLWGARGRGHCLSKTKNKKRSFKVLCNLPTNWKNMKLQKM